MKEKMEIQKPYAYHKPSDEGLARIKKLREAFSSLDSAVREIGTPGREASLAITHLETAAMWAIKSVVCNDPASVVDDR